MLDVGTTGLVFRASYVPGLIAERVRVRADRSARARALAAADDERRRVVRDLHDGAQQRLVHTVVLIKLAQQALEREDGEAPALLAEALDQALAATTELRELARGAVPVTLRRGGLRAAAQGLAERSPIPVHVDVSVERLPAVVEATGYFVIAEALTNVAKHARARAARVAATLDGGVLRVQIDDDGVGGADAGGSGLVGLAERVSALDGVFDVRSAPGSGTCIAATIPLLGRA
jgi:signal transduction histidine kinase